MHQPGGPAAPHRVLRHLEHPGRVARRLDGRLPGCDAQEGALPEVRGAGAGQRAGRLFGDVGGGLAPVRATARRRRRGVRRVFLGRAEFGRDRRRQGSALRGAERNAGVRPPACRRDRAGQARGGGVRARSRWSRSSSRGTRRACSCFSGSATRRTGSRSDSTASGAMRRRGSRSSTRCPGSGPPGGARCSATSARPSGFSRPRRRNSRVCPGSRRRPPARSTRSCIRPAGRDAPSRAVGRGPLVTAS